MPSDTELLAAYLTDRDVSCPTCGYSLRGLTHPRCPECGRGLSLRLQALGPGPPDAAVERARLREYLAANDAKCPRCRRGLRGHDGVECPGCGLGLSVWLLRPRGVERPVRTFLYAIVLLATVSALLLAGAFA